MYSDVLIMETIPLECSRWPLAVEKLLQCILNKGEKSYYIQLILKNFVLNIFTCSLVNFNNYSKEVRIQS